MDDDFARDWITIWRTELAGIAADPDWTARAVQAMRAWQAALSAGGPAPGHEPRNPPAPGAASAELAFVVERLDAIERRLSALERPAPVEPVGMPRKRSRKSAAP